MFNLFKKKSMDEEESLSQPNQEDQPIVAITFYMDSSNEVKVDIAIEDHDEKTIKSLCKITDLLSTESCYVQTVEMIVTGLSTNETQDQLTQFLDHIKNKISNKLLNNKKDSNKNQPCIRPSDMLK